jgi:ADP-ribose pyrophosphatase YjhB (NUDIX family)
MGDDHTKVGSEMDMETAAAARPLSWPKRLMRRLFHWWFLVNRPMTLGVRGMVIDAEDRVLLVRHTYIEGWHMPGGGIETREDALTALSRELEEEARIKLSGPVQWHGLFFNAHASPRDHVGLYVVRHFEMTGPHVPNHEIAEVGFFARHALPNGTSAGTRRRIAEVFDGLPPDPHW